MGRAQDAIARLTGIVRIVGDDHPQHRGAGGDVCAAAAADGQQVLGDLRQCIVVIFRHGILNDNHFDESLESVTCKPNSKLNWGRSGPARAALMVSALTVLQCAARRHTERGIIDALDESPCNASTPHELGRLSSFCCYSRESAMTGRCDI